MNKIIIGQLISIKENYIHDIISRIHGETKISYFLTDHVGFVADQTSEIESFRYYPGWWIRLRQPMVFSYGVGIEIIDQILLRENSFSVKDNDD